ncbi:UDP-3-O-(3-hydroxymyristoyl)glucosamine N-acyltransferase [Chlorobium sp. BLA1]|uniref:UDP-3-O-(3-hydroxymyristoyl)glucosamine N-acyltransferase n=1 Tax=Candidatus Chlorobium masyuteum TaxID=2716876 RepID=UPI00141EE8BA|nr:UDP-3-O-(3-hydroxymyristoyl)glucosamine N-acyltransferase [Candidatus Chlorobium masyuteum]NHQ60805.1 UDP-3-O-(3-hydroxymyristoyl)glucosamine N-acyltransferase [Candidatus Chlorobium masyuteum]NTU45493.1 UDP-3-O-(3-hydroxymyristoyl)glucosamine N-acyltransferase [Chlorobiaceae bacterium]
MTIQEIREYLLRFSDSVELLGSGEGKITGPAKIELAGPGQVSFIANEKYIRFLSTTEASLVIVHPSVSVDEFTEKRSFLKVSDPYTAFVFLLKIFAPPRVITAPGIASSAVIGSGTTIADGVSVGEYAVIGDNCSIGRNSVIGSHSVLLNGVTLGEDVLLFPRVTLYEGTVLGNRVVVHSGSVIGADGFGFAPQSDGSYVKIPQMGVVEIGDDVEIGANSTIDRATMGSTVIGRGVKIDNLVQIAHNCKIGDDTVIAAQAGISGSVVVGRHCLIGGQAGFAGHLELADNIQVAAKTGISKSFLQPGTVLRGTPAQPMRDQLKLEAMMRNLGAMKEKLDLLDAALKERKSDA